MAEAMNCEIQSSEVQNYEWKVVLQPKRFFNTSDLIGVIVLNEQKRSSFSGMDVWLCDSSPWHHSAESVTRTVDVAAF